MCAGRTGDGDRARAGPGGRGARGSQRKAQRGLRVPPVASAEPRSLLACLPRTGKAVNLCTFHHVKERLGGAAGPTRGRESALNDEGVRDPYSARPTAGTPPRGEAGRGVLNTATLTREKRPVFSATRFVPPRGASWTSRNTATRKNYPWAAAQPRAASVLWDSPTGEGQTSLETSWSCGKPGRRSVADGFSRSARVQRDASRSGETGAASSDVCRSAPGPPRAAEGAPRPGDPGSSRCVGPAPSRSCTPASSSGLQTPRGAL